MREAKRKRYIENLAAGIHTLAAKAEQLEEEAAVLDPAIKSCVPKKVRGQDRREYYIQVNPNKAVADGKIIRSYKQFEDIFLGMLERIGASGVRVTRADLAIDSFNPGDYELFQKLNKLLLCCLADELSVKNCYHTRDLWTNRSLSIAIKNDVMEAENYDKSAESGGKAESTNRLEIRSKRIRVSIEDEFLRRWFDRLDKAVDHFESVQQRYNQELARIWEEDQRKPEKSRDYISLTAFLLCYKDCIFTRRQLQSLLAMIGVENPERKAKNFKDRHTVEFFSKRDLILVCEGIKAAIKDFFEK